jgi:hypothetical protein
MKLRLGKSEQQKIRLAAEIAKDIESTVPMTKKAMHVMTARSPL